MSGYTFKSASAWVQNSGASTSTPNLPGTHSAGDRLFLVGISGNFARTATTPAGYTLLANVGTNLALYIWTKIDSGSESAPSITWNGTADLESAMAAFGGDVYTDDATCVQDAATNAGGSSSTGLLTSALTVSADNALLLLFGGRNKTATSNGSSYNALSGWTEMGQNNPGGSVVQSVWEYQIQTTATNISASSITMSGTAESVGNRSITLSIKSMAVKAPPPLRGFPPVFFSM